MLRHFLEFFIPLFFTMDAFGLLPIFLGVTERLTPEQRRKTIFEAVSAGLIICLGFMFLGEELFRFLGITENHFKIAGGIILLVLAVVDLLTPGKPAVHENQVTGIVPLAMPLIAGPATLATILVLAKRPGGYAMTALSIAANLFILLVVLFFSSGIARAVGINALRAFSKLMMVLLAAIAVSFILTGLVDTFGGHL